MKTRAHRAPGISSIAVVVRLLFDAVVGVAIFACESSTGPAPAPMLQLFAGDGQTAEGGTPLRSPIVVKAVDSSGRALADQVITFEVTSGGGTVSPARATSNRFGLVQASWTLGPLGGPQTMTARIRGTTAVLTVRAAADYPRLALFGDPYYFAGLEPSIGIGQLTDALVGPATLVPVTEPLLVTLTHVGAAHTYLPPSVTLEAGAPFTRFRVIALSIGVDTLVASAPGYSPVTLAFTVDSGAIQFGLTDDPQLPPAVGGVREVYLCAYPTVSAEPITFSLTHDANIEFATQDVPSTVITSVVLPAEKRCAYFLVRGLSAGRATVTITSPNYRTRVAEIRVVDG